MGIEDWTQSQYFFILKRFNINNKYILKMGNQIELNFYFTANNQNYKLRGVDPRDHI